MDERTRLAKISDIRTITVEILEGNSEPLQIMKRWPFPKGPFLVDEEDLRHCLDHYAADKDIRSDDSNYEASQKKEVLEAFQKFLKSNVG